MKATELASASAQDRTPDARDRILAAAQTLFAQRGFEGVSTTEIAREAGITQPLIHYHFKNKEALWKATVARVFGRLQEELLTAMSRVPLHDSRRYIAESVRQYVALAARHPEAGQFILQEGGQASERLEWLTEHWLKPALMQFRLAYEQASAEGWIKPVPLAQWVTLFTATTHQMFSMGPMMDALFGSSAEARAAQTESVTRLLLAALMTEPEKALAW